MKFDPIILLLHQPAQYKSLHYLVNSGLEAPRLLFHLSIQDVDLSRVVIHYLETLYWHLKFFAVKQRPEHLLTTIL